MQWWRSKWSNLFISSNCRGTRSNYLETNTIWVYCSRLSTV